MNKINLILHYQLDLIWYDKKIFELNFTIQQIVKKFKEFQKQFLPFRDASDGPSFFNLTHLHCFRALFHMKNFGICIQQNFDHDQYEYFSQLQNGYLNWILKDKILAFSSPISNSKSYSKSMLEPESYIQLFKEWNVQLIIRLNKPSYDKKIFQEAGIKHLDLYFEDGNVPNEKIIKKFLKAIDECKGVVAVHCRAGLGRTGTLIGIYLMIHFGFSATEVIAYLRFMRPGSVLGKQQNFLVSLQQQCQKYFQKTQLFRQLNQQQKDSFLQFQKEQEIIALSYSKLSKTNRNKRDQSQGDKLIQKKLSLNTNQFIFQRYKKKIYFCFSQMKIFFDINLINHESLCIAQPYYSFILKERRLGFVESCQNFFYSKFTPYGELSLDDTFDQFFAVFPQQNFIYSNYYQ